jgi:uncharacterized protein DUF2510
VPRRAALLVAAAASLLVPLTLFLPYLELGGVSPSGFETFSRADVLLVLAGLLAAALLAGGALTPVRALQSLGLAVAAMILGALLFDGLELVHRLGRPIPAFNFGISPDNVLTPKIGVGAVLGTVAAAIATAAALAATLLREPAAPPTASGPPVPTSAPSPDAPAPGWYADPSGGAGRRYWDGARWTDQRVP